ncbi:uncharacterized protein LOC134407563 isoform X2 [Elgaria multicarinata webbii]|uniref:uncharacterized protein LOC134407563 isoform X2 n=1 Tax=Elgaria multicarinata webbii TaxID=159646 RepID=UPI002FCCB906
MGWKDEKVLEGRSGDAEAAKIGMEPDIQPATVAEMRVLLNELKDAIFAKIEDETGKISKRLDMLAAEMAKNDKQFNFLKSEVDQMGKQVKLIQEEHEVKFDDHEKRLISLEDQTRRSSLRLRNLVEKKGEDLRRILPGWFKELVPTLEIGEEEVERVHRVGGYRGGPTPRDVLLKFSNYFKKEQLMRELRSLGELKFQGVPVQVYNDLCQQTLEWRRSVKPITAELKKRAISYAWGYPVFLRFSYKEKFYKVFSLQQGLELLESLGLGPRDDVSDGSKEEDGEERGAVGGGM